MLKKTHLKAEYFPHLFSLSHKPADLSNAVLGSEKDGEFIKLPSYAALESQLGQYSTIIAQVCVC